MRKEYKMCNKIFLKKNIEVKRNRTMKTITIKQIEKIEIIKITNRQQIMNSNKI